MFAANYFGQAYFGRPVANGSIILTKLVYAFTRSVKGFQRYTRRLF